jgi:hypothetical protein
MAVESSSSTSASPSSSKDDLNILCEKVLRINAKIRFVGIANHLGTLLANAYRRNLVPLLTREETSHYVREDFESKLGRQEYSIGKYQNVIRATVPIICIEDKTQKEDIVIEYDGKNKRNKVKLYLLLSFDVDYGVQHALETKILPFMDENRKFFSTLGR